MILSVTILLLTITACSKGTFDIHNVVTSLNNHSPQNCSQANFQSINAVAGLSCSVHQSPNQNTTQSIEIYSFAKNASDACLNTGICHLMKDQSGTEKFLSFEKNVLFITYNDPGGTLGNSLIEDLRDGEGISYNTMNSNDLRQTNSDTITKVQSNKKDIESLIEWSNSMITFSNEQTQRIQNLQSEIKSLKSEIESLNP